MNVDPTFATLGSFDARFFGAGSVSLGDGGVIAFDLTSAASVSSPLYLYVGEVGLGGGEGIAGSVVVSDSPVAAIPEPSAYAMMLVGLSAVGWFARRKRQPG